MFAAATGAEEENALWFARSKRSDAAESAAVSLSVCFAVSGHKVGPQISLRQEIKIPRTRPKSHSRPLHSSCQPRCSLRTTVFIVSYAPAPAGDQAEVNLHLCRYLHRDKQLCVLTAASSPFEMSWSGESPHCRYPWRLGVLSTAIQQKCICVERFHSGILDPADQ